MINAIRLSDALKKLVYDDKELFKKEVSAVSSELITEDLKPGPLFIYTRNRRNAIYYVLLSYLSVKADRILEFSAISGQNLITQYFLSEEAKDKELYSALYYSDIAFIYLSQYDYTNEFLENLVMSLIDFRNNQNKTTVVIFDIQSEPAVNTATMAKKLYTYFKSNDYKIADITKQAKVDKSSTVPVRKARIL